MFVVVEALRCHASAMGPGGERALRLRPGAITRGARPSIYSNNARAQHPSIVFDAGKSKALLIHPERCEDETYRYRIDGGGAGSDLQQSEATCSGNYGRQRSIVSVSH